MKIVVRTKENEHEPLPTDPIFYMVGENGLFQSISNKWIDAVVPASNIPSLLSVREHATFKLPPMPAELFAQIIKFFQMVMQRHDTEVAVMLHYDYTGNKGWAVSVPQQDVTAGHVDYTPDASSMIPGYRPVGTMHSHVRMSAYHSGPDQKDETEMAGLHVTLGKLDDLPQFSMDAELSLRGKKFHIAAHKFAQGIASVDGREEEAAPGEYWGQVTWGCSHALDDASILDRVSVPEEWFAKLNVAKSRWAGKYGFGNYGEYLDGNDGEDEAPSKGKGNGKKHYGLGGSWWNKRDSKF